MQGGPSSGFGIDKSWSADQSVAPVDPSQQDIQRMIALGQAQYVMIPGVGLVLVPIMQAPTASMNVMPPYHQYGAGTTYPTAPPRTLSTQSSSIKGGFKNKVATLATMVHQSADDMVYLVQFKYLQRNYILSSEAPKNICVGEFIVVEADRGEDIGIVVEKAPASFFQKDKHTAGHRWKAFATGQNGEIRKVTRIATLPERALLPDKAAEEASITEACRERAVHQYHLPIAIIDTEFQLDRHKLTIYYEAERYN